MNLLPCPFCASKAELRTAGIGRDTHYYVACTQCAIRTPLNHVEQSTIDFWNRRADADDGR